MKYCENQEIQIQKLENDISTDVILLKKLNKSIGDVISLNKKYAIDIEKKK